MSGIGGTAVLWRAKPLKGRLWGKRMRFVPLLRGPFGRWLPRQVDAYAAALRDLASRVARWCTSIGAFCPPGVVDETALYEGNLISGAIRGDEAVALV